MDFHNITDGFGRIVERVAVPERRWTDASLKGAIGKAFQDSLRMNSLMRNIFGTEMQIDEVAFYFYRDEERVQFIRDVVRLYPEATLFNSAIDKVDTNPIDAGGYYVSYDFLRLAEGDPIRIEAMFIEDGISPLHSAEAGRREASYEPAFFTMHHSFKVANLDELEWVRERLRDVQNNFSEDKNYDIQFTQSCTSTYGEFDYYYTELGFLKPRLNRRDKDENLGRASTEFGMAGLGSKHAEMAEAITKPRPVKDTPQA